jgi:hypothetical protein
VGDEAEPAGVVFVRRVVQALAHRRLVLQFAGSFFHDDLAAVEWAPPTGNRGINRAFPLSGRNFHTLAAMLHCGKAWASACGALRNSVGPTPDFLRAKGLRRLQS